MTSDVYCVCGSKVEPERVNVLNSETCFACAQVTQKTWQKPKGVMIWDGKTAPTIQILTPKQFETHREYNPYGRDTGRGSGLHRITKTTSSM
jgi:hypothetical protein